MAVARSPVLAVACFLLLPLCIGATAASGCLSEPAEWAESEGEGDEAAWDKRWGRWRASPGNFVHPRGITVATGLDGSTEVYVVDKTMRVQVFTPDGEYKREWRVDVPEEDPNDPGLLMPGYAARGYPVGVTVCPTGERVFLANTHYSEVAWYTPDGDLLGRQGSYGDGPGEFVFPVRISFLDDGSYFVTEYGFGQHRIQRFDAEGDYVLTFGAPGSAQMEFNRPNGVTLGPDNLLYICDASNHRIQVFDSDGTFIREFGQYGDGPDGLRLPYGIAYDAVYDRLLVAEYSSSRISAFRRDGTPLGKLADGAMQYPWDIAVDETYAFVPCYRNHRVVRYRLDRLPGAEAGEAARHDDDSHDSYANKNPDTLLQPRHVARSGDTNR